MNNIIVHFNTLQKHLTYLHTLFEMFRFKRINLTAIKLFLNYLSITLLNQQINNLNIFTIVEKIIAITSLRFFFNLRNLKIFIKFID